MLTHLITVARQTLDSLLDAQFSDFSWRPQVGELKKIRFIMLILNCRLCVDIAAFFTETLIKRDKLCLAWFLSINNFSVLHTGYIREIN